MTTLVEEANRTDEDVPEGHGVMAILDKSGDTRVIWDPDVPEEVASARRTFDELRKKGYQPNGHLLPDPDAWITQKLFLEHDEDHFLSVANLTGGERPPRGLIAA